MPVHAKRHKKQKPLASIRKDVTRWKMRRAGNPNPELNGGKPRGRRARVAAAILERANVQRIQQERAERIRQLQEEALRRQRQYSNPRYAWQFN